VRRPPAEPSLGVCFMTILLVFACLLAGLYLAIDSTAGERERGSLEARSACRWCSRAWGGGKLLSTFAYICISLALRPEAFVCLFASCRWKSWAIERQSGAGTALIFFAICLPFRALGAPPS